MRCFQSCNYLSALLNKTIIISVQMFSKPMGIRGIEMFLPTPTLPSVAGDVWIPAHTTMMCIHHEHNKGSTVGRDVAGWKQLRGHIFAWCKLV